MGTDNIYRATISRLMTISEIDAEALSLTVCIVGHGILEFDEFRDDSEAK